MKYIEKPTPMQTTLNLLLAYTVGLHINTTLYFTMTLDATNHPAVTSALHHSAKACTFMANHMAQNEVIMCTI